MQQQAVGSRRQQDGVRFQRLVTTGPGLHVSLDFAPDLLIANLVGELRVRSRRHLKDMFRDALTQRPGRLVIDTSGLVACDEAGLAGLVESLDRARPDAVPVAICGLAPVYQQTLERVSHRQHLKIRTFGSLDEAVEQMMSSPGAPQADQDTLLAEVRNLHRALLSRAAIDQTKGILMVIYGLDPDAAFAMLVWHSRGARLPLRDLAARFLAAVRDRPPGSLTMVRTDALLADLASQPASPGRYL